MSQENTERLRVGYEALARGDMGPVLALFDPDLHVEDHDRTLEGPRISRGHDGFLTMFSSANEGFEDVRYAPERFDDLGDRVLVVVRRTGRGSVSGVSVDERQFHVFDFEGERVIGLRAFLEERQALEAVGLRE